LNVLDTGQKARRRGHGTSAAGSKPGGNPDPGTDPGGVAASDIAG